VELETAEERDRNNNNNNNNYYYYYYYYYRSGPTNLGVSQEATGSLFHMHSMPEKSRLLLRQQHLGWFPASTLF